MKYYLIAGEASGDLHGSNLMQEILALDPLAEFRFYGGDLMEAVGGKLVKHYKEMAFMGFVEVLMNLQTINQNLKACKIDLESYKPDVVIMIDYPGFNLRIAAFAKNIGIKTVYYISPKIWAWNQKRVHKIKKIIDHMMVILPFEVNFYNKFEYKVDYVGNPLKDAISNYQFNPNFRKENNLSEKPIIAILPGSRKMELKNILPAMLSVVEFNLNYQFVVAGAPGLDVEFYNQFNMKNIPILFNCTYDILQNAEAAIVTSGTATLETAILSIPQVVCYRANAVSVWIARQLVSIKFISLVNLIADKKIVAELIQEECNTQTLQHELKLILKGTEGRTIMLEEYQKLNVLIGEKGASKKAAESLFNFIKKSNE